MSDHPDSTSMPKSIGELTENIVNGLAKAKAISKEVAAFRSLEPGLHDLTHMSAIAADVLSLELHSSRPDSDGVLIYTMSEAQRDKLLFAIFDVHERVTKFKELYFAAWDGERAR